MNIFGLAFILYVLKWSDGRGFWEKMRQSYIVHDESIEEQDRKLDKFGENDLCVHIAIS